MRMEVKALFGRNVWCAEGINKCLSSAIEVSAFGPTLKVCEPSTRFIRYSSCNILWTKLWQCAYQF